MASKPLSPPGSQDFNSASGSMVPIASAIRASRPLAMAAWAADRSGIPKKARASSGVQSISILTFMGNLASGTDLSRTAGQRDHTPIPGYVSRLRQRFSVNSRTVGVTAAERGDRGTWWVRRRPY